MKNIKHSNLYCFNDSDYGEHSSYSSETMLSITVQSRSNFLTPKKQTVQDNLQRFKKLKQSGPGIVTVT